MRDSLLTKQTVRLLYERYVAPRYFSCDNLWNGLNNDKHFIDFLSVDLWDSHELNGFEIKSSRSDWIKEIQQPNKSKWFVSNCNRFWGVASKPSIIKIEELPPEWGLLEVDDEQIIHQIVPAPPRHSPTISKDFLCVILRNVFESTKKEEIDIAYKKGFKEGVKSNDFELDRCQTRIKNLEKALKSRKPFK